MKRALTILFILLIIIIAGCKTAQQQSDDALPDQSQPLEEQQSEEGQPSSDNSVFESTQPSTSSDWFTDLTCDGDKIYFTLNNIMQKEALIEQLDIFVNDQPETPACEAQVLPAGRKTSCDINTWVFSGRNNFLRIVDDNKLQQTAKVFCS